MKQKTLKEAKQNETEHLLSTETNKKRLLEDVKQEILEDDFTAGYEAALRQFTVMQQSEQLLQAYKEGFDAAVETLVGANKVVQQKRLQ